MADYMYSRVVRIVSFFVLFFFLWTFGGVLSSGYEYGIAEKGRYGSLDVVGLFYSGLTGFPDFYQKSIHFKTT